MTFTEREFDELFDRAIRQSQRINLDYNIHNTYNLICFGFQDVIGKCIYNSKINDFNCKPDFVCIWGHLYIESNYKALKYALQNNIPLLLCEDGFIRSVDTCANNKQSKYNLESCSITVDTKGFHYDNTQRTDLETLLNTYELSKYELKVSNALIRKILKNKLTKYNHQPLNTDAIINNGNKKVLVVDQSYNDWSVRISGGNENIFKDMLNCAIQENPHCDIYIKTHPDSIVKNSNNQSKKCGYFQDVVEHDNIYKITECINPIVLLEKFDKIYVYSTQFGYEAILMDKEIHVFGTPFYSGWGLTIDQNNFQYRNRKLSKEELFYIVNMKYTLWYDLLRKKQCSMNQALDSLLYRINKFRCK